MNEFQLYKQKNIDPINYLFKRSLEEPFRILREKLKITFKIETIWENWGPCEPSYKKKGIHKKLGKCRLRHKPNIEIKNKGKNHYINTTLSSNGYDVPCKSIQLNRTFPKISRITRFLPDFTLCQFCDITTDINSKVEYFKNTSAVKYIIKKQIAENGHITLICPETNANSKVEWFKDNEKLNSSFENNVADGEEPHLTIDTSYLLYILHATKHEEGTYLCSVDDKKILECEVKVVSQSKLLNQEFFRYSIYLGFVLSLTITCYCAGICVAWHRRTAFEDPLCLNRTLIRENKPDKI